MRDITIIVTGGILADRKAIVDRINKCIADAQTNDLEWPDLQIQTVEREVANMLPVLESFDLLKLLTSDHRELLPVFHMMDKPVITIGSRQITAKATSLGLFKATSLGQLLEVVLPVLNQFICHNDVTHVHRISALPQWEKNQFVVGIQYASLKLGD